MKRKRTTKRTLFIRSGMAAALVAAILFVHGRGGGGLHARSSGPDPGRIYYDERAIHFDAQGFGDRGP